MFKRILIGFAAFAIACVLVRSGYEFGKSLAQKDKAQAMQTADADSSRN